MTSDLQLTVLGARGTAPSSGKAFIKYGGATTCFLLRMGGERILLDAGSGLMKLPDYIEDGEKNFSLLLSHPHLDHLIGFLGSPHFYNPDMSFAVYAVPRLGLSASKQLETFMSVPFWPVNHTSFSANLTFHDIEESVFNIGQVRVDCIEGSHPGGCSAFKFSCNGRNVVFATDFEMGLGRDEALVAFSKDCDLLLCDGKCSEEEYACSRGFGHSTWNFVAKLGALCGARETLIIHHAPDRTDSELDELEQDLPLHCHFAKEGDVICL